ncbi:MAG: Monomeric sarcosine oxidase [Phycisphaerae bacterium]|nr:Monomeric sarcosine oxidase [Phycisphaerae bacterium]
MNNYDVIVLGVGGMGSAACDHLAGRGARVLGLEQFDIAHDRGSSHGDTRIIRKAYFEHPDYVPLLHKAYRGWDDLAQDAGEALFERCGLLLAGPPLRALISGARRAAEEHELALPEVAPAEVERRFPGLVLSPGMTVLWEGDAGYLCVEACVRAAAARAARRGATIRTAERVLRWTATAEDVEVTCAGATYRAGRLVICGGPWAGELLSDLRLPLAVRRKVQLWFPTRGGLYAREHGFPVFAMQSEEGFFYGFPSLDGATIKVAEHTGGDVVARPEAADRSLQSGDVASIAAFIVEHLPGVDHRPTRHAVCFYTMTPDEHFIIDRHPAHAHVCFAAGFSGHGFKFAPIVGSILADLALTGTTEEPSGFLRLSRFQGF